MAALEGDGDCLKNGGDHLLTVLLAQTGCGLHDAPDEVRSEHVTSLRLTSQPVTQQSGNGLTLLCPERPVRFAVEAYYGQRQPGNEEAQEGKTQRSRFLSLAIREQGQPPTQGEGRQALT